MFVVSLHFLLSVHNVNECFCWNITIVLTLNNGLWLYLVLSKRELTFNIAMLSFTVGHNAAVKLFVIWSAGIERRIYLFLFFFYIVFFLHEKGHICEKFKLVSVHSTLSYICPIPFSPKHDSKNGFRQSLMRTNETKGYNNEIVDTPGHISWRWNILNCLFRVCERGRNRCFVL